MSEQRLTERSEADLADQQQHVVCCHFDILLCGLSGEGVPFNHDLEASCVVCAELEDQNFCPVFGECPSDA